MKKKITKSEKKKTSEPKIVNKKNFKFLQFGKKEEPETSQNHLSYSLTSLRLIHKHNCTLYSETEY